MKRSDKQKESDSPPERRGRVAAIARDANLAARTAFVRAGFSDPTLVLRWREIAGAETARLAWPVRFAEGPSGGVLTLKCEPAAAVFLQHETRALCERINAYLGRPAIAKLRFVPGTRAVFPAPPASPTRRAPVPESDPSQNYEGPEGLRLALLALAGARRARARTD